MLPKMRTESGWSCRLKGTEFKMNARQRRSRYRRRTLPGVAEMQKRHHVPGEAECRSMRGNGMCECAKGNHHQAARLPYLILNSTQATATPHISEIFLDLGFEYKRFESGELDIKGGVSIIFRGFSFECVTKSRCRLRSRASWSAHNISSSEEPSESLSEMGMMQSSSSSFHALVFEGATQH